MPNGQKKMQKMLIRCSSVDESRLGGDECFAERVCLFVFVALRPMSTAMAIAGRSVHLTTLFSGQA